MKAQVEAWLAPGGWRPYAVAVLLAAAGAALGAVFLSLLPEALAAVLLAAVVATAWLAGPGPAVLASLLGAWAHYYLRSLPGGPPTDLARTLVVFITFLFAGLAVASLTVARRRAEQTRAAAAASEAVAVAAARATDHRAGFLAEVGALLASSLDFDTALDNLAHLAVNWKLADWCLVDVYDTDGSLRRVAAVHADPAKQGLVTELQRRYTRLAPRDTHTLWKVLLPEKPWIDPAVDAGRLEREARDPEHYRLLRDIGFKSEMVVPLTARGHSLGAITLVRGTPDRPYGPDDLALAQELARRAGLAADNARLYAEAQRLNAELEQRVQERTEQLIQSHAELSRLSAHLQTAREEERARIAREIHDELGGSLTGVKMDVARLRRLGTAGSPEWLAQVEAVSAALDNTVQTVRRIATELRPAILDDFGLVAAIEWQLNEFRARSGLQCELQAGLEAVTLDRDSATAVFRVFQETLTNIARHAQASAVHVRLYEQPNCLVLEVRDNGQGMDLTTLPQGKTFGLVGMRERVRMLAGQLDLESTPGHGTTVVVRLPVVTANGHGPSKA